MEKINLTYVIQDSKFLKLPEEADTEIEKVILERYRAGFELADAGQKPSAVTTVLIPR